MATLGYLTVGNRLFLSFYPLAERAANDVAIAARHDLRSDIAGYRARFARLCNPNFGVVRRDLEPV